MPWKRPPSMCTTSHSTSAAASVCAPKKRGAVRPDEPSITCTVAESKSVASPETRALRVSARHQIKADVGGALARAEQQRGGGVAGVEAGLADDGRPQRHREIEIDLPLQVVVGRAVGAARALIDNLVELAVHVVEQVEAHAKVAVGSDVVDFVVENAQHLRAHFVLIHDAGSGSTTTLLAATSAAASLPGRGINSLPALALPA
jgi:hypothetical protein